jgi:poly-gamma-glutamate capsule biosynthesis protein CapA/YwtB (metallophosphatase superfamily)
MAVAVAAVGVLAVVAAAAALGAIGPAPSPEPSGPATADRASDPPSSSGEPTASPIPTATPTPAPPEPVDVALALVADVREPRVGVSGEELRAMLAAGQVALPCGIESLALADATLDVDPRACVEAEAMTDAVRDGDPALGLLPAALVTPRVKVLRVDEADLFGGPSVRALPYPLAGAAIDPPAAWASWDPDDVRTLISTGDTCPDRGVSHQSIVLGKGWDWVLDGGTAVYTGTRMDRRFTGPNGNGWPVVIAKRSGNAGAVRALISDAEMTLNDFECPMTKRFKHHPSGTVFSIDPQVAGLLARNGVDVVTLASNHMTDQGTGALKETLALFDEAGIARFGAGMDIDEAMEPAVLDVRGVRFAFVGFNEIPGSAKAGASTPGVVYLTEANVRKAVAAAREVADVVIVVPQWGWPEYHANFTARQKEQMKLFWDAGADHVIGHGTHWASAVSITPDGDGGQHFVISSHGNFLFGQDWSRQTQEGVVVELTFAGTRLAQARLHPYIMLDQAQANLTDPVTDGSYVLNQVWEVSTLK